MQCAVDELLMARLTGSNALTAWDSNEFM